MSTPSNPVPSPRHRLDLLSPQLKRSLLLNLAPYDAGFELTATLWISGYALTRSSAYITAEKGLRLQQNSSSMKEDFGDYTFVVGRTTYTLLANEIDRLLSFFASENVAVEVFKL
jgi:hypothetical protein